MKKKADFEEAFAAMKEKVKKINLVGQHLHVET